jgi:thioredoxin 2
MAPEFSKAAAEMQGRVRFAKIDTERFQQLSARFAIRGIPLLILFEGGRERGRLTGLRPAAGITDFLRQSLPALV